MAISARMYCVVVLMVVTSALVSFGLMIRVSAYYTSIDVGTAYDMIRGGGYPNLVILDVRTKDEYDGDHIYGATLIPVTELQARIGELASHKNDPILVYCGSGGRSRTASDILYSNGFTGVYNMLGGLAAWMSAGYPMWTSTVHNINTTYNYDTIQAAIDSALTMDNNTILVDMGLYREHVVVSKALSIIGADPGNTVIDGYGTGTVVSVTANHVKVESFAIQNSSESGVRLVGGNYTQIRNNKITNNYCGVNVSSSYNAIFNNEISSNQHYGVLINGDGSTIFENNVTNNSYGIGLDYYSDNNSISGNKITNNGYGITLSTFANYNSISGNVITTNSGAGILLSNASDYNSISGNGISNNSYGISLESSSSYNTISGNNITSNNSGGIWLDSSFNNTVSSNNIANNEYGIYIRFSNSSNTKIFHNNFVSNSIQVFSAPDAANIWDDGYPSGGNYWSDYTGVDANGDGIGDAPYIIDSNNQDNFPLYHTQTLGDINHDGTVDIVDIVIVAAAFNSIPGDSNWNPIADVNNDGIVDIIDIVIVAAHLGETSL